MFGLSGIELLLEDGERVLWRGRRDNADHHQAAVLAVVIPSQHPTRALVDRLAHEYELRDKLDFRSAVRPRALLHEGGRIALLLDDPGGQTLEGQLGRPMELGRFLRLAVSLSAALREAHANGIIHKDIKPANVLVSSETDEVWLTGFGIASQLPRERQPPAPPEIIAGTLAYMAPEQTGRMNRSIDTRSDLYALGVTFYQMLTGVLPFTASDPLEWVHCHIARRPAPPGERLQRLPRPISDIIMKLLAKTPEERYQTSVGLDGDLRRCLTEWQAHGQIESFPLGTRDLPDRLLIPEKLYGREREIEVLLAAFDRVVMGGPPELVLVVGYSGIGKSAVVNELHRVLVPPRGLFASGKFDQYKRNIPYSTLAQAFQGLIRPLLAKSEVELSRWRDELSAAIDPNGALMVQLVPELAFILGPQPPIPELPPKDAQRRFQLVFRRFLGVFARAEHPLALFLDDLQWLDTATLDLLEHLVTSPELRHVLFVGAYRDNEVTPTHLLMRRLTAISEAGGHVREIVLAPLGLGDVGRLIDDALYCASGPAEPLALLVHAKTAGNPFFTIQFLSTLADERLLAFDHSAARWSWNLERIHAMGYTENVVDLMLGTLRRLPSTAQKALQQLACLGNSAPIDTLALVHGGSKEALDAALWQAVKPGLVLRQEGNCCFLHDRVQEAAYVLFPEGQRPTEHLRIGRVLAAHTRPEALAEHVFEIVSQFNRSAALITAAEERARVAELNLIAGRRAMTSTAYGAALIYLVAGAAMLDEDSWARCYDLTFSLELARAECEFLTGALGEADDRLAGLARRAASLPNLATVTRLQAELFTTLDRSDRSIEVALDYLGRAGIVWSAHPTLEVVRQEYAWLWQQLGERSVEALLDLPRLADPAWHATMDVLTAMVAPALFTDQNLYCVVIGRMANLSLEHGNSDASSYGYAMLGTVLGPRFGDYKAAFRFAELGFNLVEKRGLHRFDARVYLCFGNHVAPWTQPIRNGRSLLRRAIDSANQSGDLTHAAISHTYLITHLLGSGDALGEIQREAEAGLDFARHARFGLIVDRITGQLQLIRTLRGLTPIFGTFNDAGFDEERFEQHLEADPRLAFAACWYWIRKLQARLFANDYAAAVGAADKAEGLLWTTPFSFEITEYHLYAAVARAALCDTAASLSGDQAFEALAAHHQQLEIWARNCPENFENRAALVAAEIARLEGRDLDAARLYEQAIRSARANGFAHNEALACELAARFYVARGFEINSHAHLRNARHCYESWGADGKVRQLDQLYPYIGDEQTARGATATIGAPVEHLDLATVIKVSHAVSSEIVLEKLIDTLMHTAIEQAGAERGLLILAHGAAPRIAAEATISGRQAVVHLRDEAVTEAVLPEAVLRYVLHTSESVILDDAAAQPPFAVDPYINHRRARSILCLPLINQAKLIGALYLENNLTPRVFAPARTAALKLLASQAAISLENSRLYRDLQEREAKIRRLVDANIIGIFSFDLEGRIVEANDAFLRIVRYDREDLVSGRIRWTDLTPPEWRDRDAQVVAEMEATGIAPPYEKEYFRKDGSRVPVLVGAASFEETDNQGLAFVLDLTERNRAEAKARESEGRYREVQRELAHANRVATMGQLTASIAHEVKQPIAAAVTNAQAALRLLAASPPDLEETREALADIVEAGNRANDVIEGIRALIKKSPPRKDRLEINGVAREVIELAHGEAVKSEVSVETRLVDGLPLVEGDRVQLQQVVLNLIVNAIQAMDTLTDGPRELLIATGAAEPHGVVVAVSDTGPGLAPENVELVFDAFYSTKPGGLGMGLSICRSIVEAHGGRFWLTSNQPRGATFHFTVPAHS